MKNINIIVENKKATVVGLPVITCGNSDYTVTFAFDDEWNLTGVRTARFVYVKRGEVMHEDKVFEGNTVAVPVLSDVAFVNVGVFAGDLCTTTPARVACRASILCGSGAPQAPTPDVYAQIMALFNSMAEKGAFGATEAQAQQIEQNRQDIAALEAGTKKAGDAEKLGGHGAEYFAPLEDLEAVQTTSKATLSKAGWYRVAEYKARTVNGLKGFYANNCVLCMKKESSATDCEFHIIEVFPSYETTRFNITGIQKGLQSLTKIRYTADEANLVSYLEIYHSVDKADRVFFEITHPSDYSNTWKAITPTLTEETAEGVTVTATYNIPANAYPVTDLDLLNYFKNTGGIVTGDVTLQTEDTRIMHNLKNNKRRVYQEIDKNGVYYLFDDTNKSSIIVSDLTGAKTFCGMAEFLKSGHNNEFNFKGISSQTEVLFNFRDAETDTAGTIPLKKYKFHDKTSSKCAYIDMEKISGSQELLHTGNSAKVVISDTAPSDTSALWVY